MILDGWQRECLEQKQIRTVQERKLQYSEYDRGYNKGRADGAREFAEWIHKYLGSSNNVLYTYRQSPVGFTFVDKKSVDEILAEWQKGKE